MKCEKLDVWKRASSLSANIYLELRDLKDFGFKDQITRNGLSVPSNIAEGLERVSDKEKIRFLDISRASVAEVKTQIYIGMKIDYIVKEVGQKWIEEFTVISKMISSLIKSIRKSMVDSN